jgi:hypothetical protein
MKQAPCSFGIANFIEARRTNVRRLLPAALMTTFAFALIALPARGATIYTTTLSGTNEVPPTASAGTGTVDITLAGNTLDVSITFSGLSSGDTAAHIHCCAAPGVDAGVALPFTTFPTGAISGTFTDAYDLTSDAVYNATFLSTEGGTAAAAEAALIAGLNDGMAYVNIHSGNFPDGEIRGQVAIQALPEPSTLILSATMLVGIIALKKSR